MKITLTLLNLFLAMTAFAQVIAGFENFNLQAGEYINDASPADGFESGSIVLPNYYNDEYDFWSGFAISADTNTTTPGFLNQYSAYPGSGAQSTPAYAMGYIYDPLIIKLKGNALGKPMAGMYVANSTYAYLSMRDGDAFAKKFGGETGNDPDFFLLSIKKYAGGVIADDSINVYLADYRADNASKDYILSDWLYVDLTILGGVDSLILSLRSSDVGAFGMNTPAYVAIDQVSTDNLLAAYAVDNTGVNISLRPNPVKDVLFIDCPAGSTCSITSMLGAVVWSGIIEKGGREIHVANFPPGIYSVSVDGRAGQKIVIE